MPPPPTLKPLRAPYLARLRALREDTSLFDLTVIFGVTQPTIRRAVDGLPLQHNKRREIERRLDAMPERKP